MDHTDKQFDVHGQQTKKDHHHPEIDKKDNEQKGANPTLGNQHDVQ
jgi:hypothetical protein